MRNSLNVDLHKSKRYRNRSAIIGYDNQGRGVGRADGALERLSQTPNMGDKPRQR